MDTAWSEDTFDTFSALDVFLNDILQTDHSRIQFLLGIMPPTDFESALEERIFPLTSSCEGFVLSVAEAIGPLYNITPYQTVPSSNSKLIHAIALATHPEARYTTLIDSTMSHLVRMPNTGAYLYKNLGHSIIPPSFVHNTSLPTLPLNSPIIHSVMPVCYLQKNARHAKFILTTKPATKEILLRQPFLALKDARQFVLFIRYRRKGFNGYGSHLHLDLDKRELRITNKSKRVATSFNLQDPDFHLADVAEALDSLAWENQRAFTEEKRQLVVDIVEQVALLPPLGNIQASGNEGTML